MKKLFITFCIILHITVHAQQPSIIPMPAKMQVTGGNFELSVKTKIVANSHEEKVVASFLNDYLNNYYGFRLNIVSNINSNCITLSTSLVATTTNSNEKYILNVTSKNISIIGNGDAGVFYGVQSLIQLLPVSSVIHSKASQKLLLPCIDIEDEPRFQYRGMHLDVSRHFFSVDYIKKYIDYIALHKMNTFHWHLTDDQGWRIEIKQYPKLTNIGAWREGTIIGRFPGKGNDNQAHGGFYTQDQIKEIVQYAAERFITVVPEIEMPGHSMAVLAAYPEFGTTPNITPKVPMTWGLNGVENNVLAPTEKTFKFLEEVLTEVMDLFPSKIIHIGGDECSKIWWKKDSASQQLMRANNLKNEDELQSYFIQRIEKFVNTKGKKIIGWDEILEGGLAPNALVMSWTGEQGGIHAAKEKHEVVMTPGGWCYFDHSQTKIEDSVTIGGYTTLEKVYNYEPIPKELNAEEAKYIIGAQGNVWTEYMAYPSKIEYMIFPRMSALSEVLWSPKASRNWESFEQRLPTQIKRYELWKANYSKAYYEITTTILPTTNNSGVLLNAASKYKNGILQYKSTSSYGTYTAPIEINNGQNVNIDLIERTNKKLIASNTIVFNFNKATGKKISVNPKPSASYPGDGAFTLVNGIQNTKGRDRSSEFIGYSGNSVEAIIDLGSVQTFSKVTVHSFESNASWIYAPSKIEIFTSTDGSNYTLLGAANKFTPTNNGNGITEFNTTATSTQFIKIMVHNFGKIPEGKNGAGKGAWLFLDEIEVN